MASGINMNKRKEAPANDDGVENPRARPGVLSRDLLKGLQDPDKFCDVTLIGSDGGRVPAIRNILAMRSPVLERMLIGSFQEAQSSEVKLGFPANVLLFAVEWCVSDTIESFVEFLEMNTDREKDAVIPKEQEREIITTLEAFVETAACAHYLGLASLEEWLEVMLRKIIEQDCTFALTIWDSALKHCVGENTIGASALEAVRLNHKSCLGLESESPSDAFLQALSSNGLQTLVKDATLSPYAVDIFKAIKKWSEVEDTTDGENRTEVAKTCAAHIDLLWIPPKLLLTMVRDSGLIAQDKILDAAAEHARFASPHSVHVIGAGAACVNGVYERSNWPVYTKKGKFKERDVLFGICKYQTSNSWFISTLKEGGDQVRGTSGDIDFYHTKRGDDLISGLKLRACESDMEPPPNVFVAPTWNT